jgi:hypothetical protein
MSWLEKVKTLKGISESLELSASSRGWLLRYHCIGFLNVVLDVLAKRTACPGRRSCSRGGKPNQGRLRIWIFVIAPDDMDRLACTF